MKVFSKSSLFTLCTKVLIMAAGVITSIITAKTLGPKGRGELVFVLSFGLTVANFSNMGLPSSNIYMVGRNPKLLGPVAINSFYLSVIGGIIALLCTLIFDHQDSNFIFHILFLFIYVLFLMLQIFVCNLLVSINEIRKYNFIELTNVCVLILYIYGFYTDGSVNYFLVASLSAPVVGSLMGILFLIPKMELHSMAFNFKLFTEGFRYAIRVYATAILYFAIIRGNVFMISFLKNNAELGYYSIAMQIVDAVTMFSATIALLLFPYLLTQNQSDSKRSTIKVLILVAVILISGACILGFTIKPMVLLVFGIKYLPVIPIVYASLPVIILLGVNSIASQHIAAAGYPAYMVWIWGVGFLIWLISSFFLIRLFGGVGAYLSLGLTFVFIFSNILIKLVRS